MDIEFDPAKDAANIAKHGVSLARAADLDILAVLESNRAGERRWRAYGILDGKTHCLAFAQRNGRMRAISLRRATPKEMKRFTAPAS